MPKFYLFPRAQNTIPTSLILKFARLIGTHRLARPSAFVEDGNVWKRIGERILWISLSFSQHKNRSQSTISRNVPTTTRNAKQKNSQKESPPSSVFLNQEPKPLRAERTKAALTMGAPHEQTPLWHNMIAAHVDERRGPLPIGSGRWAPIGSGAIRPSEADVSRPRTAIVT